jgi:hypothetical protein
MERKMNRRKLEAPPIPTSNAAASLHKHSTLSLEQQIVSFFQNEK